MEGIAQREKTGYHRLAFVTYWILMLMSFLLFFISLFRDAVLVYAI